jgi:hypothetical protein
MFDAIFTPPWQATQFLLKMGRICWLKSMCSGRALATFDPAFRPHALRRLAAMTIVTQPAETKQLGMNFDADMRAGVTVANETTPRVSSRTTGMRPALTDSAHEYARRVKTVKECLPAIDGF